MENDKKIDVLWDDNPVEVTQEANFIWSIANKLRGTYMPDKYGDVIIPMTIIRRFECALEETKDKVVEMHKNNPTYPARMFEKASGFQFYCTSEFTLKELCNDSDHLAENFKSYIEGFSPNVQNIMKELDLGVHIDKMNKGGCLLTVVKAFSELDLNPKTYDSIKMGYIFENLIGRFFQNVDAGQYYTGRDIIKMLVSVLTAEGCDDIFDDHKVVTVCDQACGTGGMLSTAYSYLKHSNPTIDVRLFGQEYMGPSYAIGLAEMLIKGQDSRNFRHADTFKTDCFEDTKMRFVIENPPFGTPWSGKDAKEGQEEAVLKEFAKRATGHSRWGAGLPGGGDSQLIFMQSAIDKMDDKNGRAAIIENGSPLFTGSTSSSESQIRRWMIENDLIEAIIAMPTELFYNTEIQTYAWILSKNKRKERKGKIQLIDATSICHKLRKGLGHKKNEFTAADRKIITDLYLAFEENEFVQIYDNTEFLYREYSTIRPLQRSYGLTENRLNNLIENRVLASFYDPSKVIELENSNEVDEIKRAKEQKKLREYYENRETYEDLIETLKNNVSTKIYYSLKDFSPFINKVLCKFDKKIIDKVCFGLSEIDEKAEVQKDKKGNIILDKETKDIEIVKWNETINDYMKREVWPHYPSSVYVFEGDDENASFEDDFGKKNIRIGAEIPFVRYFYKFERPSESDSLLNDFKKLEKEIAENIEKL